MSNATTRIAMALLCISGALTAASLPLPAGADHARQDGAASSKPGASSQDSSETGSATAAQPAGETVPTTEAAESELLGSLIGSPHDFSEGGREPRDLCLPCHTPHMTRAATPALDGEPSATDSIHPYQSTQVELSSASLMCLSCHDGVVARDVYSRAHSTALSAQLGASTLGVSPLRSHPVGVRYPAGERNYRPAAAVTGDGRIQLPGGRLQCTTCHDPHNAAGVPGMLVKSNRRSDLCLSCHQL
jgi:predicted CXXCH cytochrome family protein